MNKLIPTLLVAALPIWGCTGETASNSDTGGNPNPESSTPSGADTGDSTPAQQGTATTLILERTP